MSWFKKPINIGITIGAALLAVAAIFLVVWGVTHHTEGGMLEVCWAEDGQARYVGGSERDHGACEGATELRWPQEQIPLTLAPVTPEGQPLGTDTPQVRVLAHTVANLNRQVGFELFRVGTGLQPSDAEVRFGGALSGGEGNPPPGYVTHFRLGGTNTLRGHVWIRSDVAASDRLLSLVCQHELLHLAGLAHDDFTLSIMYPLTREEWDADTMSTAHVTDHDISNLQARYHRQ